MDTKEIQWKDISIGDTFVDGSSVTEIHDTVNGDCYGISYTIPLSSNSKIKRKLWSRTYTPNEKRDLIGTKDITVVGDDHLLLIDISNLSDEYKRIIDDNFGGYEIPTEWNRHIYYDNEDDISKDEESSTKQIESGEHLSEIKYDHSIKEKMEVAKADPSKVSENEFWLPASYINVLIQGGHKLLCNGHVIDSMYIGELDSFCVETDSHKYEANGLIHHNSVMLQNIIFHTLTHGADMAIALVDLKYTEFSQYKPFKNVVAVANSVREARELLLIARRVMDKRNKEMAKKGIKDMMVYKPQDYNGEVIIAGRKMKDTEMVEIRTVDGEKKTISAKEVENYLEWDKEGD